MESYKVLGLLGFILAIISLVLPWVELYGPLGLHYSHYGFLTDGVLSFIVLIISFVVIFSRWDRRKGYLASIFAFLAIIFPANVAGRMNEFIASIEEEGVMVTYGAGLPLMIIACIIMIIAGIMMSRYKASKEPEPN